VVRELGRGWRWKAMMKQPGVRAFHGLRKIEITTILHGGAGGKE